ncbi:phosphatidylinositol phosphate synthase [Corynebacterium bovis]|uniref:Phosphatidylinositol phosphate synthase n=1 Tax=Corynebacterium bovis TaxID=36808 RepID=A0A426Q6X3_9CORY|nr:CDP-alcohol phosphatidyltransferase family protein [Corynebacterium bovis]RRO93294.1 phosphatidylglycerophosphate synthase [Corynebacterium bovis]RRO98333.1 phosphatidylglycerophosphate synthase [Corynebacterium bovis]RRQ00181.1 phosphatidylglycerophosphate synthase [Corynebacterium bovis]RRQ01110.1 phosphatidylglycerophosphate synthase [Corynebacterium bovis]RRQ04733.1 phosphatidylglycerophosphate synthase [Corynebacterium bovis]
MLSVRGRGPMAVVIEPVARRLVTWGVTPNAVTVCSTVLAVAFAVTLVPTGHHFLAGLLIGLTVLTDMVDGTMARMRGGGTKFGATLDATCDRIADGALFGAVAWWLARVHDTSSPWLLIAALVIIVASQVTSYVKARAEASGIKVDGGLIERPERLIIGLVTLGLGAGGLGIPYLLGAGLTLLAVGSVYTVLERLVIVARAEGGQERIAAPTGAREFPAEAPGRPGDDDGHATTRDDDGRRGPTAGEGRS